jgi:hypothetical protein
MQAILLRGKLYVAEEATRHHQTQTRPQNRPHISIESTRKSHLSESQRRC